MLREGRADLERHMCRRLLVIFADVVQCCHDRQSLLPACFMWVGVLSVYICAPCTLLVSLKGRQGRVPNPLTLKLQGTKPPCGCWELLFWHQLLLSKKIPAYQTAEQGGNIPGPWYALLRSQAWVNKDCVILGDRKALVLAAFSVRRVRSAGVCPRADTWPQCLLLSDVNCRCLSDVWDRGYVWKGRVWLVHQTGCFFPWDPPFTSENFRWRAVVIQMGRHWQLMQWVSPSLQGRRCCYGDKWEPGKLILCSNNSLMSAERFGDINVNCRYQASL